VLALACDALESLIMAGPMKKKIAPPPAQSEPVMDGDDKSQGPVLTTLAKRLRACRKKLRKIEDIEAAIGLGKEINEEQRVALSSKPGLVAVIDELEKLTSLVGQALVDEAAVHRQHGYENAMAEVKKAEAERHAKEAMEAAAKEAAKAADKVEAEEKHDKAVATDYQEPEKPDHKEELEKVLQLLYFSHVSLGAAQDRNAGGSSSALSTCALAWHGYEKLQHHCAFHHLRTSTADDLSGGSAASVWVGVVDH
jgi:hypothetical protein